MLYAKQKHLVRLVAEQVYEKEKSNSTMINILSHIVEFRNGESGMHVLHIQTATDILLHTLVQKTDQYHLSAADISLIRTASALHDIGKISIPESILNKPGRLTKEEFEIMKTHTTIGADILDKMCIRDSYYQAWMLAMLCLLAKAARQRFGQVALAGASAAVLAVFCWRGVPAAGFWTGADSLYTLRAAVQTRAAAMNTVLNWKDRVLVLSQGDDATRWYYYRYELTAQVVNGFGGFYGRLGETQDRWDSDFMNLVESENWTLYDYKAVCVPETLVAYMAEKDCDYLLIDRSDGYLRCV